MWVMGVVGVWFEEGFELQMEVLGVGGEVGDVVGVGVNDGEREQVENGEVVVVEEMEVRIWVVNEMVEVMFVQMGQWGMSEEVMGEVDRLGLVNVFDGL